MRKLFTSLLVAMLGIACYGQSLVGSSLVSTYTGASNASYYESFSAKWASFLAEFKGSSEMTIVSSQYAYPQAVADIDVTSVTIPADVAAGCANDSTPVTVDITNVGTTTASNIVGTFSVDGATPAFSETIPTSLPPNASFTYTFMMAGADLSAPGPHTVTGIVTAAGDVNPVNDSAFVSVTIDPVLPTPLAVEDLTGYTSSNLLTITAAGWFEATGVTTPTPDPFASWLADDFANFSGGPNGTGASINLWLASKNDWIVSPKFIPTVDSKFTFDMALTSYRGFNPAGTPGIADNLDPDDRVEVRLSNDCGVTWITVLSFDENSSISNLGQQVEVDLAAYAGQTIQVAIWATEGTTSGTKDIEVFVDNLQVRNVLSNDVAVISTTVSDLAQGGCGTATEQVTIQVRNVGASAATGLIGTFAVDGVIPTFTEPIPGTLQPGDTVTYTFTNTADVSAVGPHTITGVATFLLDANNANDSLSIGLTTDPILTPPLPAEDLTTYDGGNLATISGGWFEASGVTNPSPNAFASWISDDFANLGGGPNGVGASINLWLTSKNDWIVSPKFTAVANTAFNFDLALTSYRFTNPPGTPGVADNLDPDDLIEVRLSNDCGATWITLLTFDQNSAISNTGQSVSVPLGAYAGQDVQVAIWATEGSTSGTKDIEVFVDNLLITNLVPIDAGATALVKPSGAACFGTADTIEVTVQNFGTSTLNFATSNMDITAVVSGANTGTYTATISSGTLAAGASADYQITTTANLSGGGVNNIQLYTTIVGDGNALNDTTVASVSTTNVTMPYLETFDNGFPADWVNDPNDDGEDWQHHPTSSHAFGYGPDGVDHTSGSGGYLWGDDSSFPTSTTNASVITPCVDLVTASPVAEFWIWTFNENTTNQDAIVHVDLQVKGDPWLLDIIPAIDSDTVQDWRKVQVDLTPFAGATIQMRFRFEELSTTGFEHDPAIDDFTIYQPLNTDLGVVDFSSPSTVTCATTTSPVVVDILASGLLPVDFSNDTTVVTVDITGPINQSFSDSLTMGILAKDSTLTDTITTMADFSAVGTYTLKAYTSTPADFNSVNDTLTWTVVHPLVITAPYAEPFDTAFPAAWINDVAAAGQGTWSWTGNVSHAFGYGPDNVDHTSGTGNYIFVEDDPDDDEVNLFTPCIDLSNLTTPGAEFWIWSFNESTFGDPDAVLSIALSVDGGPFVDNIIPQIASVSPQWLNYRVNLLPYAGSTVQFRFTVDENTGWFQHDISMDDFRVYDIPDHDMALIDVISPAGSGRQLTSTQLGIESVTLEMVNLGASTETNIPVSYTLNGTTELDTVPGPVASGDTVQFTFAATADLSLPGTYTFSAVVSAIGDTLNANDSVSAVLKHVNNPAVVLPYEEGFESAASPTAYSSEYFALEGIERFDFTSNNNGRLRTNVYPLADSFGITLDAPADGIENINFLILTLNMSNYTLNDTILMDFLANNHGEEPDVNDRVWIRGNDTLPWIEVANLNTLVPSTGTTTPITDVNLTLALGSSGQDYSTSTQIRFGQDDNFQAGSISGTDGYTFDNIFIRKLFPNDVGISARFGPAPNQCGDSLTFGEVLISNFGTRSQTSIPIVIEVSSANGTEILLDTLTTGLAFQQQATISFGPFNTFPGGLYTFKAYTDLTGDSVVVNDTLTFTESFFSSAAPAFAGNSFACPGDSVILFAVPELNTTLAWYATDTSATPLGLGNNYKIGPISAPVTYYLGGPPISSFLGGKADNTGGGGNANFTAGIEFTVDTFLTIDSVTVYPDAAGDVVVNVIEQATGAQVYTSGPIAVNPSAAGAPVTIAVGARLTPGDYIIDNVGTTTGGLYRNNGGVNYPYTTPGILSLTNSTAGNTFYYFFYNWQITVGGCERARAAVTVNPQPLTTVGFTADTSVGDLLVAVTPSSMNADSTVFFWGDGTSDQSTMHMYPDTGFYSIMAVAYGPCGNDTLMELVFISCTFSEAGFTAADGGDLLIDVTSTATNADSVLYIWGDGTSGTAATHMYPDTGMYIIQQVAYSVCGNDTTSLNVTVSCNFPMGSFIFDKDANTGVLISFTGTFSNADSIVYDFGGLGTSNDPNPTFNFQSSGNYPVTVTVYNVCGSNSFSDTLYLILTDLDAVLEPGSLSLFPNPADKYVNLSFEVVRPAAVHVEWVDARGRQVSEKRYEDFMGVYQERMKVENLAEGMYLVKIHIDDQVIIRKVQVK